MKKVIVIGGNAAGLSAASQIKRQKPAWETIVIEKGRYISYAACGIPYYIAGLVPELDELIELTPKQVIEERKIDLRLQHEVTNINPDEKVVELKTPTGTTTESFDFLVISTGAIPSTKGITVSGTDRIFTISNLESTEKITDFMTQEKPQTCAVIGGGYIAVEMLEAFRSKGLETHMIHRREDLSNTFEKELSNFIKEKMRKEGIILHLNTHIKRVDEKNNKVVISTETGELLYDFVVIATGVAPNTAFLKASGIELGIKNSVKVNTRMQTNYPYIYAAGDCAQTTNLITGRPDYVALALKANREGYVAGVNICGGQDEFPGVLGTAITKIFDLGIARTGLSLEQAQTLNFNPVKYLVSGRSRARYYPGGGQLHTVVIAGKDDGRILGAQLAGPLDAVKRIDVYAVMIQNKMTIADAFNLDVSYAPPFAPVYDPVVLAARVGKKYID
ncbi:MAG: FAD-dependent oxidoreductase [Bacillota bacterium]|nr:FAD-dependent oxidoreductase [Bacillota bacterium]MDW7682682.1 FAD-dependent oxidoreductase [Bacillota bacterium]